MSARKELDVLISHQFRHDYGKLVSVLTGIFGAANLSLAEDIVQDTFLEAMKNWSDKGVPDNPSGWLYRVAKNKTINVLKRETRLQDISEEQLIEPTEEHDLDILFDEKAIRDEQLKMMFVCCHPSLSVEAQTSLILKTLCGFSIDEIARAFLSKSETITKRLMRSRKVIREVGVNFQLPERKELENRLDAVLKSIYLLYNEGYSASRGKSLIKKELCEEAIRLVDFLCSNDITNTSKTHALLSLMYFHFSRFDARMNSNEQIIPLEQQDRRLWNAEHIALGFYHLSKVTEDKNLSTFHIEATIAACHASAEDHSTTDWERIVDLYTYLYEISPSPIVLLNKTVAVSYAHSVQQALDLIDNPQLTEQLNTYYLYHATKADFFIRENNHEKAISALEKAMDLTKIPSEKSLIKGRLNFCLEQIQ
ncbi:sigma-70 family RNA polymerase sigma factor [Fulvivirga sp. M361]|uniref:RNA polymerase sigma factor n=1 Tax=Fulvivirga sp. M361 TaxID=2594266 RepID=UPI00117AF279|nr:sigma-70 family RNA polymerase sigma factor [Fulvivirga sp. M361]TRX60784.1 sigma-70 family RNA polymerase sigma factor [Fulvivirga sp. M361]